MTQPPATQPTPPPRSVRRPSAEGAGKWTTDDLRAYFAHERISTALVEAAMQDANKTWFSTPDEAKALAEAFAKKRIDRTYP